MSLNQPVHCAPQSRVKAAAQEKYGSMPPLERDCSSSKLCRCQCDKTPWKYRNVDVRFSSVVPQVPPQSNLPCHRFIINLNNITLLITTQISKVFCTIALKTHLSMELKSDIYYCYKDNANKDNKWCLK